MWAEKRGLHRDADTASASACDMTVADSRAGGIAAAGWALLALVALFANAVVRLGARGIVTIRGGLDPAEWLALVLLTVLFVWGEGVRGLQRRWVPGVLRRVAELRGERHTLHRLLAPLYAMSLIAAPKRTLWRTWAGVAAIVAAVLIVRAFPAPWRGMTDFAVAAALAWGLVVIVAGALRMAGSAPREVPVGSGVSPGGRGDGMPDA